jgi:hypothetical protein
LLAGAEFVALLAGVATSSFGLSFASIENAVTLNVASALAVDTISTPKQIWFKVDLLESQPLAIVHFMISRRFIVPDVKLVVATKAM